MAKLCSACGTTYDDAVTFCPADGAALRPVGDDATLVGAVIAGRYLVSERLGEGGMGTVFLGRHVRLPQQVAIKVMRPELLADPVALARFNREAANAASIEHERVVRVYDFGETADGMVYLAMEYVPGRTLKALVAEEGPLAPARAAALVRQVAEGVEAAHRLGIIHRDLKPDNILVVRDPDGGERCKVLDFGIARPVGGGDAALTRTGFIVGTPEYMSPEQVLGGELDARSDVYALALVTYHLLTGALPFDTSTPDRGLTARLMQPPRPLRVVRAEMGWPPALQAVLDAALALDVGARTGSALAFAQALSAAVVDEREGFAPAPAAPGDASPAPAAVEPPVTPTAAAASRASAAPRAPRRTWRRPVAAGAVVVAAAAGWLVMRPAGGEGARVTPATGEVPAPTTAAPIAPAPTSAATPATTPATTPAAAPETAPPATSSAPSSAVPATVPAPTPIATPSAPPVAPGGPGAGRRVPLGRRPLAGLTPRQRLDSLRELLDPATTDEATARRLLPALRMLIADLETPDDSTWGFIRLAEGYLLAGEQRAGCATLQRARLLARTMTQREAILTLRGAGGCGP